MSTFSKGVFMVMLDRILPGSFIEMLAGILLIAALVFALISLFKGNKKPVTRLAAILFVASLCLFSDNGWIYFIGVLLISSAIVDLDFLQNFITVVKGHKLPSSVAKKPDGETPPDSA